MDGTLARAEAYRISGLLDRLAWLTTGALPGAVLPVLGVVVIAAFNAYYWLPIRGESPGPRTS